MMSDLRARVLNKSAQATSETQITLLFGVLIIQSVLIVLFGAVGMWFVYSRFMASNRYPSIIVSSGTSSKQFDNKTDTRFVGQPGAVG